MAKDHRRGPTPTDLSSRMLAEKIVRLERMVQDLASASQAADRSIEDGAIDVYDDDDNLQVQLGRKKDGKHGAGYVGTAQPPRPTPPDVLAIPGGMLIFWDGKLEEATDIPIDRVAFFASNISGFKIDLEEIEDPDPDDDGAQEVGAVYSDGGGTCVIPTWGEEMIYIRAVAISESGVASEPTVQVDGYAVVSDIAFFYDTFVLDTAGTQDLHLTFEPIDFSEHVYWHAGGEEFSGTFQEDDITWTRDGQTLTVNDTPYSPQVGDLIGVKYAYLVGAPQGNRVVVQIVSSSHTDTWEVHLRWALTEDDDQENVTVHGVNVAGPWDPQEVGFVELSEITLRFVAPEFTVDFPSPGHMSRVAIAGEDDEGEYTGHRYTLFDTGWNSSLQSLGASPTVVGEPGCTTPADFSWGIGHHSSVAFFGNIGQSFGSGLLVYDQPPAWACMWDHLNTPAEGGSQTHNCPPDEFFWTGSFCCREKIFKGPWGLGWHGATSSARAVGWHCQHNQDGWMSSISGSVRGGAYGITLSDLQFTGFAPAALAFGPAAGHPLPVPPPGKTLEWEFPKAEIVSIEATVTEATSSAATGTGPVWLASYDAAIHGFGPNPGDFSTWKNVAGYDNEILNSWSGGGANWVNVTSKVKTGSGERTFFTLMPAKIAQHEPGPSGRVVDSEWRGDVCMAFRFQLRARRYRFVPVTADQQIILDVKSYTDIDEL